MNKTLSRMERLARAEEERKRFRQSALQTEPLASSAQIAPVPNPKSVQSPSPAEDSEYVSLITEDSLTSDPSPQQTPRGLDKLNPQSTHKQIDTVAQGATVAHPTTGAVDAIVVSDATVAPNATVAPSATEVQAATVAAESSQLYPDATVAEDATVAPHATVAGNAPVEIRGYGHFTWDLFDRILPRLDPYEQVVLLRLCRLAWGHKRDTCRVGYERLQQTCNLKKRKLQEVIAKLEFLDYIERLSLEQGGSDRSLRGTEYRILLPPPPGVQRATVAHDATVAQRATVASDATNKKNVLKDNSKGGVPSRAEACPDCGGTSWVYPNGPGGGVKRCKHPRAPRSV
jgi:hypothetical protein